MDPLKYWPRRANGIPIFCGPFEILAKKGLVAYELALPTQLRVHNVFHASLLKKYVYDTKHVVDWSLLQVEPDGKFSPEPTHIGQKISAASKAHRGPIESVVESL